MAQSDNTLGAPTEGLGQTVTFAAGGQSGVPQTQAGQRGILRGQQQAQGAQTSTRAQIDTRQRSDGTAQLLYKMGSEFLRPHVEAAQQEQYFKGMQEASAGNAITDIVADQPWYSQVFGSTSLVDGARAYSANAVAQNFSVKANGEMQTLRTMSPSEMQKWSLDRMAENKTGDAGTDALAMQAMSRVLPGIYERQAKENLLWHTENLSTSVLASGKAASSAYTSLVSAIKTQRSDPGALLDTPASGVLTDVDKLKAGVALTDSLAQPATIPTATWNKLQVQIYKGMLDNNQLAAFNVVKQSGLLDKLPIEYKDHIDQYAERTEAKIKANLPESLVGPLADLYTLRGSADTPEGLAKFQAAVPAFNDLARDTLGISSDMFSNMSTVKGIVGIRAAMAANEERTYKHNQSLADRAATEEGKRQAASANLANNIQVVINGGGDGIPESDVREAMVSVFGKESPLTENLTFTKMAVAQAARKVYSPDAKNRITSTMNQVMSNPDQFSQMYSNKFLPLVKATGDLELATVYFGNNPKHAAAMATFHASMAGMQDTPTNRGYAHAQATLPPRKELRLDSKGNLSTEDEAVTAEAKKYISLLANKAGHTGLLDSSGKPTTSSEAAYIGRLLYEIRDLPNTYGVKEKVSIGAKLLADKDVSFVGGHYLEAVGGAPNFAKTLKSLKAPPNAQGLRMELVPEGDEHKAVKSSVDYFVKGMGMEGVQVIQEHGTRPDGQATLIVMGMVDNSMTVFKLSTDVIAQRWAKEHPTDVVEKPRIIGKPATPVVYPTGPMLNYKPDGPLADVRFQ